MRARDPGRSSGITQLLILMMLGGCTTPDKVALQEYAPQSPDADIEAVSLSASDDDTFDPERVGTEFPDTTEQVAVWYRWQDADSGKKVGIRWSKDGEVVLEQGDTLAKVSGASAYILKMAAGSKLPIGDYQVELLEDGVAVTKIPFKVGDGSGGPTASAAAESDAPEGEAATELAGTSSEEPQAEPEAATDPAAATQPAATTEAEAATETAGEAAVEESGPVAPEAQAAAAPAGAVIASHQTKWPGIVVELTELARKGKTLNAKLRFTNRGSKEVRPEYYYRDTYVLDEDNKKYEVLKDDKGTYLGSLATGYTYWWGEHIEPGASRMVWMRFEAPPPGVKAMTLQVGEMDPFEDVRIQN